MFTLAWPWLLLLLPLPILFWKKKVHKQTHQGGHLQLPGVGKNGVLIQQTSAKSNQLPLWLIWGLLVFAISRPLWVGDAIELPSKGRDLMLAVDLSGSMQIEDMVIDNRPTDRFTMVQHLMNDFIARRQGDKLGLILFADHAYLQAPLTQDRRSIAQFLSEAQIGLVGKQTAIGEAIALGVKRFDLTQESNRVLILLTDGSNNSGSLSPDEAAAIAAKRGVTIYAIGIGADVMERRTIFGREKVNPSSDLDEKQLTRLATVTHGRYFRARNSQELEQIYHEIDKLEPTDSEQLSYRPQSELFYYPLALALFINVLLMLWRLPFIATRIKINKPEAL